MSQRIPLYRRVSAIRVDTNRRNPGAVVRYIMSRLDDPTPNTSPSSTASGAAT